MKPTTNRPIERRKFLSLAASASTLAASCAKSSTGFASSVHPSWPSERIRVGAIGIGGRGALLLEQLPESAQIVAAADCNETRVSAFREKVKGDWPVYSDYRKVLDRNDIDAVIVATGENSRGANDQLGSPRRASYPMGARHVRDPGGARTAQPWTQTTRFE